MNLQNFENSILVELANYVINYLKDCNPSCYGCDLHNEIFNSGYYIIGYYQAEQWLINNGGIFSNIEIIKDYENDNFGEVNTDFSSSEAVCNMTTYIAGEEVLSNSKRLEKVWNERLTDKDVKAIIKDLENYINSLKTN